MPPLPPLEIAAEPNVFSNEIGGETGTAAGVSDSSVIQNKSSAGGIDNRIADPNAPSGSAALGAAANKQTPREQRPILGRFGAGLQEAADEFAAQMAAQPQSKAWVMLDPHDASGDAVQPLRVGVTYQLPPGVTSPLPSADDVFEQLSDDDFAALVRADLPNAKGEDGEEDDDEYEDDMYSEDCPQQSEETVEDPRLVAIMQEEERRYTALRNANPFWTVTCDGNYDPLPPLDCLERLQAQHIARARGKECEQYPDEFAYSLARARQGKKKRPPSKADNITGINPHVQERETDFTSQKSIKQYFPTYKGKGGRDVPLRQLKKLESTQAKAAFCRNWRNFTVAQQDEEKARFKRELDAEKAREEEAKKRAATAKKRAAVAKKIENAKAKAAAQEARKQKREEEAPEKERQRNIRRNENRKKRRTAEKVKEVSTLFAE